MLGDAAHATTPNLGQGACQAMEDALLLARAVHGAPDLAAALRSYANQRYARTAVVTVQSWRLGKMITLENPVACWLRDRVFTLASCACVKQMEKLLSSTIAYLP